MESIAFSSSKNIAPLMRIILLLGEMLADAQRDSCTSG